MSRKSDSIAAVAAALEGLTAVGLKIAEENGRTEVELEVGAHRYDFRAVWVGHGWPSEVREALEREDSSTAIVYTARRFSPGAISILKSQRANWADESGQAHIALPPGLLIAREAPPAPDHEAPQSVRWSSSSTQIAELVLHEGLTELHTGQLAEITSWSAAQVSKVLKMFDHLGWTEQRGGKSGRFTRRELVAPGPLLDSWSGYVGHERRRKVLGHRITRDLLRFAQTELADCFGQARGDWALTTWAGLELTAPFATIVPALHVYVSKKRFVMDLGEVMRSSGIRRVDEGAPIEFWEADFPLIGGSSGQLPAAVPVASTPRLYADLLALGGRGADAAQHLRETKLGF